MPQLNDQPTTPPTTYPHLFRQVPPVFRKGAAELVFTSDAPILKVASLGDLAAVSGVFAPSTEYWFTPSSITLSGVKSLSMRYVDVVTVSNTDIVTFSASLTLAFTASGSVPGILWTAGTYAPPSGSTAYVFTTPDPDDSTASIGLVLTLDASSSLIQSAWYKTASSREVYSGSIWSPGNVRSPSLHVWTFFDSGTASAPPRVPPPNGSKVWYFLAQR